MSKRSSFERIPRDLWERTERFGECWIWRGCVGSDGYGHVRCGDKIVAAHRASFALAYGRVPSGHVLHSCDNPRCINPDHLSEGSHRRNMRECALRARNRTPRPGNGYTKLSGNDVAAIKRRFAAGETNKSALAREYGVTPPRIRQVLHG